MNVSVILPVHNGQRFIEEALACLARQTLPPDEVVVVDDGSTDGTVDLVRDYQLPGLRLLQQAQSG
ncbi:glycosyltransferase, partial [Escherichia coli]|uniref:glycosyltransferase family 2 protein n=1 Tax=Escherichia coli TaxID=562 RepID=UPI002117E4E0